MNKVKLKDILDAKERISKFVKFTDVLTCKEADRRAGRKIYFKAEHLQSTGSFKVRGALNAVLKLKEELGADHPGVITHSSGNHGQALAWAANIQNMPCTIVVPRGTPSCKTDAIKSHGAELVECFPSPTGRVEMVEKISKETGQVYISSCDHPDVIAGQGTIGLELLTQIPDLDAVFASVSGGGLASGLAVAIKAMKPTCKIYLATPTGKMLEECFKTGERLWPNPPQFLDTLAEGIKLQQLGYNTFEILQELAEKEVFEVTDEQMVEAMKFSFQRMKQVIEAAAGAAVAPIFTDKMKELPDDIKNVAVVLCGGNTDIDNLPWYDSYSKAY